MSILTKAAVTKGDVAIFQLNLRELLENEVITDSYFTEVDNLSKVVVHYRSTTGSQRTNVIFAVPDGQNPDTPIEGQFKVSTYARDEWEVDRIVLLDEDGGSFNIDRADLNTAEFDLDLGAVTYGYQFSFLPQASYGRVFNSGIISGFSTSFLVSETKIAHAGYWQMKKNGTGGGGNMWLEIYAVDGSKRPTTLIVASEKKASADISADGDYVEFIFPDTELAPANYALVVRWGDGYAYDGSNNIASADCIGSPQSGVVSSIYRISDGFWDSWPQTFACGLTVQN